MRSVSNVMDMQVQAGTCDCGLFTVATAHKKFGTDYDETFCPVIRQESLRVLRALSVQWQVVCKVICSYSLLYQYIIITLLSHELGVACLVADG